MAGTGRGPPQVYIVTGYLLLVSCCHFINAKEIQQEDITTLTHIYPIQFVEESTVNEKVRQQIPSLEFEQPTYTFTAKENTQDHEIVGTVRVENPDGVAVTYSLNNVDPVGLFTIESLTGIITIQPVGIGELLWQYNFTAQADATGYSRAIADVTVDITDVNEHSPVFNKTTYRANVQENGTADTQVIQVLAYDLDHGKNGEVTYSIWDENVPFRIDPNTGNISTNDTLNHESNSIYTLTVIGEDRGQTPRKGSCNVIVTVDDINDNQPYFKNPGTLNVNVTEDTQVNANINMDLGVIDADSNANEWNYTIMSGNVDKYFHMDENTGDMRLEKTLDYEKGKRQFSMNVSVSDGSPNHTSIFKIVDISVTNVNDESPVFVQSYNFNVTENQPNVIVGVVVATDPDKRPGEDQNIKYLFRGSTLQNFTINEITGEIQTNGILDREATMPKGIITINPWADDGVNTRAMGYVEVTINDENDNQPYIQSPDNSKITIYENIKDVKQILVLNDEDTEKFGCPCKMDMDTQADKNISDFFSITLADENTSRYTLTLLKEMDRETQDIYTIMLKTTDKNGYNGGRTFTVEVGDKNDCPMSDGNSRIHVYQVGNHGGDAEIGNVYVTDEDLVGNKTYTLNPEIDGFIINKNTGAITMKNGTSARSYTLNVQVQDMDRAETAKGTVNVDIEDIPVEAIEQSGSLKITGITAENFITKPGDANKSPYDILKSEIADIFSIAEKEVNIFTVKDFGSNVLIVRFNCRGSNYFTAPTLNGLILINKLKIESALNLEISQIDINDCLNKIPSPTNGRSCRHYLINKDTSHSITDATGMFTMVGVAPIDTYEEQCYAEEPQSCDSGYCLNGGTCTENNATLTCKCHDSVNYGPRCELMTARFSNGYSWYESCAVCENPTLEVKFRTENGNGVIIYNGPLVEKPWPSYPGDSLYIMLDNWDLQLYVNAGDENVNLNVTLEQNTNRDFEFLVTWNNTHITLNVSNCNNKEKTCENSELIGTNLLTIQAPLQLGGMDPNGASLTTLSTNYSWGLVLPSPKAAFTGCIKELRLSEHLYDLAISDHRTSFCETCTCPVGPIPLSAGAIAGIVSGLLILLLIFIIIIFLLHRRHRKSEKSVENNYLVRESVGSIDRDCYPEKDGSNFDLNILRLNDKGRLLTDVNQHEIKNTNAVPLGKSHSSGHPENHSIKDFIEDNVKKENEDDPMNFDELIVYIFEGEGDNLSIASLSSIGSGTTDGDQDYDYLNNWGPRFQKLADIYGQDEEYEDDDSDGGYGTINKTSTIPMNSVNDDYGMVSNPRNNGNYDYQGGNNNLSIPPAITEPRCENTYYENNSDTTHNKPEDEYVNIPAENNTNGNLPAYKSESLKSSRSSSISIEYEEAVLSSQYPNTDIPVTNVANDHILNSKMPTEIIEESSEPPSSGYNNPSYVESENNPPMFYSAHKVPSTYNSENYSSPTENIEESNSAPCMPNMYNENYSAMPPENYTATDLDYPTNRDPSSYVSNLDNDPHNSSPSNSYHSSSTLPLMNNEAHSSVRSSLASTPPTINSLTFPGEKTLPEQYQNHYVQPQYETNHQDPLEVHYDPSQYQSGNWPDLQQQQQQQQQQKQQQQQQVYQTHPEQLQYQDGIANSAFDLAEEKESWC